MPFIHDDFLLSTKTARQLYHEYAEAEPILDYHCHLPPQDVADNRQFHNLFEIWLEGDHYKWRAMRANGVAERYCTGDATPREKFLAWARTVPHTLRNPLYHWTHLELKRYFGIDELLDESSAPRDLGPGQRTAGNGWAARARHPAQIPRERAVHDRRPHRRSCRATRRSRRPVSRPGCSRRSGPTRRSTSTCPRCSTPGWTGWRRPATSTSADSRRFRRRAEAAARLFPPDGRPAFRPRAEPRLRRVRARTQEARPFSTARARAGGNDRRSSSASPRI